MARTENDAPKGRAPRTEIGDRLTRSAIALRAHIDPGTIKKYLEMEGAPKPDENRKYSMKDTLAWIERNAPRIANNEEMRTLKESLLRMEVEDRALELGKKKGQLIERAKIRPAIEAVMSKLTPDLQDVFERELPPKYKGRSTIECAELNAHGLDRVLRRMKEGWAAL